MESKQKNARALALEVLTRCESGGYSNIALDTVIKRNELTPSDRGLMTALIYGVIERKITLDYIISSLSSIPNSKIERDTRNILRMGLYQLIYMKKIPAHAALNETVSLANKRSKGFVNAVLRSYLREGDKIAFPDESNKIKYLSVKYSIGESLAEALLEAYSFGECKNMLNAFSQIAPITLRVNNLKATREEIFSKLDGALLTGFSPDGIILENAAVSELECLKDGRVTVQDEASQICVRVLGAQKGDTVFDVCACPGSKSFGAAMTMENEGQILAFDIHESKLSLVEKGAERLGISIISTQAHDARKPIEELFGKADRIICDVPCSGFGVIGKKPEIRYKDVKESENLPKIQYDILENVQNYLKVGGTLVYSTCTILPDENENNIKKFLEDHKNFELAPFSVGDLEVESGMITLLPHTYHTDGFFIAKLVRTL
ncbi:MAG: 16S rRNA (cytosine(967)-C(5))-methyltransferase RsmB [Clostridia bacterium]|nr:16S rRNA (cytosine(967)-C(5))-methyltransferase RsmB [Clostridia bacterium]